jgi:hypothetical protein
MKSVGDNTFAFSSDYQSFEMSFTGTSMIHGLDVLPSPLQKLGPLLDGWEECIETGQ